MTLRPAEREQLPAMLRLLSAAGLPTSGVEHQLDAFVVALTEDELSGCGGLEIHGAFALLRSLAVDERVRGQGIASRICDRLEERAARRGVDSIYLLTESAERFFAKRGYAALPRQRAPQPIATCDELASLCPESAVLMALRLADA